jgi:A/G-specific adenine glycosylase
MIDASIADPFREMLLEWAEDNHREFPWREPDASLYRVFMSEMFLRRTRSDVVDSFLPEFLERYPDLPTLRRAEQSTLADVIRPMGLQNKRSSGLLDLASEVEGDTLPRDADRLAELPQVGPYVANATLCFALDQQLPIVDRNVDRIYGRLFGAAWSDRSEPDRYELAAELLPEGEARTYNLALLDYASAICTAPDPVCEQCSATGYCGFYAEREDS